MMFGCRRVEFRTQFRFPPAGVAELRLQRLLQPVTLAVRLVQLPLQRVDKPTTLLVRVLELRLHRGRHAMMFGCRRVEFRTQFRFPPAGVAELRLQRLLQPVTLAVRLVQLPLQRVDKPTMLLFASSSCACSAAVTR